MACWLVRPISIWVRSIIILPIWTWISRVVILLAGVRRILVKLVLISWLVVWHLIVCRLVVALGLILVPIRCPSVWLLKTIVDWRRSINLSHF